MVVVGWRVHIEQKVRLPHRNIDDVIERVFTVRVKTKQGAKTAIKHAGIKGRIIELEPIRG